MESGREKPDVKPSLPTFPFSLCFAGWVVQEGPPGIQAYRFWIMSTVVVDVIVLVVVVIVSVGVLAHSWSGTSTFS